jgi:hypothetical protein
MRKKFLHFGVAQEENENWTGDLQQLKCVTAFGILFA